VAAGTTVVIYVSRPQVATTTKVPSLIGMSVNDARTLLVQKKLGLGGQTEQYSDQPVGTIISQSPGEGASAKLNTRVSVVVSAGPEPAPEPEVPSESASSSGSSGGGLVERACSAAAARPRPALPPARAAAPPPGAPAAASATGGRRGWGKGETITGISQKASADFITSKRRKASWSASPGASSASRSSPPWRAMW